MDVAGLRPRPTYGRPRCAWIGMAAWLSRGYLASARGPCYGLDMDARWHIFRTTPGHEVRAARESGVVAYVPHVTIRRFDRRRRANVRRRVPMLPGYAFLRVDHPRALPIPRRSGYIGFMRNGDRSYAILTDAAFAALVDMEKEMAVEVAPAPPRTLKRGDQIEIAQMQGTKAVEALVQEIRGDTVLASIVGSSLRISVPLTEVRVT